MKRLLLLLLSVALAACAQPQHVSSPEEAATEPTSSGQTAEPQEHADFSCSYFYFLWGTHAEYNQEFESALDAFEKALVCDPSAVYIQKKIPILLIKMGEMERAASWLVKGIQKDPKDKAQYLLLAHLRIQQLNRAEAIQLYQEVLEKDPEDTSVLLRLGILYSQENELERAEKIFRELLAHNNEEYFAHLYLARLLSLRQKYDEARSEYEHALRLNWSADLVYEMVEFYSTQEKYADILRLYSSILANDAENERAALGRIQALMGLGEDQLALDELKKIQKQSKQPRKLDMAICKLLLRLGKTEEAKVILEKNRHGETYAEATYMLALIAYQGNDSRAAQNYLRTIQGNVQLHTDIVYLQVRILRDLNQPSKAVSLLLKNIADEHHRDPLLFALLSSLFQEQGKNEEAMEVLLSAINLYPTNEQILFEHALLLDKTGKSTEAVASMEKVLQLHPNHPEALNFIGYTWADQNINLDKAFEYIRQASETKPDNGFIRDSLGWVYFRKGDLEKAASQLELAIKLEPDDPNIYDHYGDVLSAMRKYSAAIESYRKALGLHEDPKKRQLMQKKINDLTTK